MQRFKILLNSEQKVVDFVNTIDKFDYHFDLCSSRYILNAKSLLGIFSCDLSRPLDLRVDSEDYKISEALKRYIV